MINQIITKSGIKGEYEVINNFSMKVRMTEPYQVNVHIELPSGTFQNKEEIEGIAKHDLEYLYNCIETIKSDFEEFERLSANYSSLESGLYIQMSNKIFYSTYEEDRYLQEMKGRLKEGYTELYDKYITNSSPLYKSFKDKLAPAILSTLVEAIKNNQEEI